MNRQLNVIAQRIKAHQLDEARLALDSYLEAHPQDAWAWYLLSFAMPGKDEKIAAAQRALTLIPDDDKIRARVRQLQATDKGVQSRRFGTRALIVLGLILVLVISAVFVVLSGSREQANSPIPTLAVLAAATNSPVVDENLTDVSLSSTSTEETLPLAATLAATTASQSTLNSPAGTEFNGGNFSPTPNEAQGVSSEAASTISPMNATPTAETLLVVPTVTASQDESQTIETSPTPSATSTSAAQGPPSTAVSEPGVPLNTSVDITIGEMRVIDAVRPGETRIRELGGSIPAAPANQAWVLVELLVACTNQLTCAVNISTLRIIGASSAVYSPSSQLNMTPIFGSVTSNLQVWGYLGFMIPNSESNLRLVLTQGSQTHIFALQ